jgi:hypothetical protein
VRQNPGRYHHVNELISWYYSSIDGLREHAKSGRTATTTRHMYMHRVRRIQENTCPCYTVGHVAFTTRLGSGSRNPDVSTECVDICAVECTPPLPHGKTEPTSPAFASTRLTIFTLELLVHYLTPIVPVAHQLLEGVRNYAPVSLSIRYCNVVSDEQMLTGSCATFARTDSLDSWY